MGKRHFIILAIASLLLCGSASFGAHQPASGETVEMAGAGRVIVIPPEQYDKSVEDVLALVRAGTREDVVSLALVEVRKKYPELKVENLALRDFSARSGRRQTPLADAPESIVVYFKDRSTSQVIEVWEGMALVREQLYRVEFVLLGGKEAIYVQMSPPPAGITGMLKDQRKAERDRPPRPSRAMLPQG